MRLFTKAALSFVLVGFLANAALAQADRPPPAKLKLDNESIVEGSKESLAKADNLPTTPSPGDQASISAARAAVAEMQRLAQTPEEMDLANRDHVLVEKAAALVTERNAAVKQSRNLKQTEMSFNAQYLQLQSQMQHENRSYSAISNIMKTKHDIVKNSISNVANFRKKIPPHDDTLKTQAIRSTSN